MRPKSIVLFDRIFLASLALAALNTFLSFDETLNQINADPAMADLGIGAGFIVAISAFSLGISLLLWYFIAHRASNTAKWILVIMTVAGFAIIGFDPEQTLSLANILSFVTALLSLAAIVILFRSDARVWLTPGEADLAER